MRGAAGAAELLVEKNRELHVFLLGGMLAVKGFDSELMQDCAVVSGRFDGTTEFGDSAIYSDTTYLGV